LKGGLYGFHHTIAPALQLLDVRTGFSAGYPHIACRPCTGGKGEILPLQSVTLTDKQFLMGEKGGKLVTLAGVLRLPSSGNDRLPVVILLHGSGGIVDFVTDWEQYLNSMGVATFTIDSFTGRGIDNVGNDQSQLGRLQMTFDT
jgi:predicted dienelactone hydrolase